MANTERDSRKIEQKKQQDGEGPSLKFSSWLTVTNGSW